MLQCAASRAARLTRSMLVLPYETLSLARHPCDKTRLRRVHREIKLNLKCGSKEGPPDRIRGNCWRIRPHPIKPGRPISWPMRLGCGCGFRTFNVLDDFRDALKIKINTSRPAARIGRALTELFEVRGKPTGIPLDNGPEFISHGLARWATEQNFTLHLLQRGISTRNICIERFNRICRKSALDCHVFNSLAEVGALTQDWLFRYNNYRFRETSGRVRPKSYPVTKFP